jgi:hypothetical protein
VRPFLLLSCRAEDMAADEEYAAFLRLTGLPPAGFAVCGWRLGRYPGWTLTTTRV